MIVRNNIQFFTSMELRKNAKFLVGVEPVTLLTTSENQGYLGGFMI